MAHPKVLIKKMLQVGGSTLVSRFLGIIRESLTVAYLGVGALSDAFVTAFAIPNIMRSIFAEGALSAAYIPRYVKILRTDNVQQANRLMTLSLLVFESILLLLIGLVIVFPESVIHSIAWGFSQQQIAITVPFLRILIFFVFFISVSALLAAALQAVGRFFIPAIGQVIINSSTIAGLLLCLYFSWPVHYFCFFIVIGGFLHTLAHLVAYFKAGFRFAAINKEVLKGFLQLFVAFFSCALSISVSEIDFIVDRAFASYLPVGSVSLIFYANRFMAIPLGAFAVAFSTIIMPHFSRVSAYAPKRLSYYLLESTKFILFITMPIIFFMGFFAEKIFQTIFISKSFVPAYAHEAGLILLAFLLGLFFFSLNKIILNMYYALNKPYWPLIVSSIAVGSNAFFNYILVDSLGAPGLALATSISALIQTMLLLIILKFKCGFKLYGGQLFKFLYKYALQLVTVCSIFIIIYSSAYHLLSWILPVSLQPFFLKSLGFWLWVGPLCLAAFLVMLFSRKQFGLKLHFMTW